MQLAYLQRRHRPRRLVLFLRDRLQGARAVLEVLEHRQDSRVLRGRLGRVALLPQEAFPVLGASAGAAVCEVACVLELGEVEVLGRGGPAVEPVHEGLGLVLVQTRHQVEEEVKHLLLFKCLVQVPFLKEVQHYLY